MFKYSIKSLLNKKTISFLFVIAMCVATSISMLAINITSQVEAGFYNVDKKYDVIVGPKGSSTQLVMSSLFFSDDPLGIIDSHYLEYIEEYNINKIVPLAMADSYNGHNIIGTTRELLEGYELEDGQLFNNSFEMVVGSNIAKRYNLSVESTIVTSHGVGVTAEQHENSPYKIVGILKETNTAYDNTCFTTIESVWSAHDEEHSEERGLDELIINDTNAEEHSHEVDNDEHLHDEHSHDMGYTALLIKTGDLSIANQLENDFTDNLDIQVINSTKVLRRLVSNIDKSKDVALLLCGIIIILASILTAIMSFLMLVNSKKDIKLLKFLGFKKIKIYYYITSQVGLLIAVSISISLIINKLVLNIANNISSNLGIVLDINKSYLQELRIVVSYIVIILLSTVIYIYFKTREDDK